MAVAYVGTSGYQYDHWRKLFYPEDLPKSRWFEYFKSQFATVEINSTFYRLPSLATFADWRKKSPDWFVYSLKYSRYGTHIKKLKDPAEPLSRFLENAKPLRALLGSILVQLPPGWNKDLERLREFLDVAPGEIRWAFEFRNRSWLTEDVYSVLRKSNAALVIHDHLKPHPEVITADWVYLRFHGGTKGTGGYSGKSLSESAESIRRYQRSGLDVYTYFNNDWDGHAVFDALDLIGLLQERGVEVLTPK